MLGRGDTGAAPESGVVDAAFWALILQDEQWLAAEFDEVVSDAVENPTGPARHLPAAATHHGRTEPARWTPESMWAWRTKPRPGRRWRRERGPPSGEHDASRS